MKQVTNTGKIPIKFWLDDIEDGAREQAENLSNLPFVFKHIAIMPDSHQGYGMPIGGVMATKDVVIPNAVGVDIGCGMCAIKTTLTDIDTETLKKILGGSKNHKGGIRAAVPVGFSHHKKKQDDSLMPDKYQLDLQDGIVWREYEKALKSLGTLGGGNHFIEIQKGNDGHIWIMIHSGSRNLGFKVAKYYNDLAISLNEKWFSQVPKKHGLAFLPIDSEEGQNYIKEMNYCIEFALVNRKLMMKRIMQIFADTEKNFCDIKFNPIINVCHNEAKMENHFGQNVMIHRKGATSAKKGEVGIIPGSQGTKSYIVEGLGNPESFESCSHGAGRKMSRTKAQETLDLESEKKLLDDQNILHAIRGKKDLDEAPGSYKDIDIVMDNQKDLVNILVELTPLAVIKG